MEQADEQLPLKRIDEPLPHGAKYKFKPMPNGELRTSITTVSGEKLGLTQAGDWKPDPSTGDLSWQEAHFHKGLFESYILVEGWMYLLWLEGTFSNSAHFFESGQFRMFSPGEPHLVLLGPNAKIISTTHGTPVGNPDRKGDDWWPVGSDFHERMKFLKLKIETDVLQTL